jgi:DNA-binding MarR family transcriptional regulator
MRDRGKDERVSVERLERAVTAFARAAVLLDGPRLRIWEEQGLSLPQLRILFRIRQSSGIGGKELAELLGVSASNVTQQVDKLVGRGLVARAERAGNRRFVSLALTPAGEQVAGAYSLAARGYLARVLETLDDAELDQLTDLLTRVVERAPDPVASPAAPASA